LHSPLLIDLRAASRIARCKAGCATPAPRRPVLRAAPPCALQPTTSRPCRVHVAALPRAATPSVAPVAQPSCGHLRLELAVPRERRVVLAADVGERVLGLAYLLDLRTPERPNALSLTRARVYRQKDAVLSDGVLRRRWAVAV
jgi:hypothetical protein